MAPSAKFFNPPSPVTPSVTVNPVVFLSILDHFVRRNENQQRVIGTLLGVVSDDETEISIRNCFPVPHSESQDQVAVDLEFHKTMFELHQRVNPKEVIVGWYATGSKMDTHSNMIHDFYASEIAPSTAVHLLVDTDLTGDALGLQAYVGAPLGASETNLGSLFVPVPCQVKYLDSERVGLDMLATAAKAPNSRISLLSDLENVERSIKKVQEMLDTVFNYVQSVLDGKIPADNTIGRHLLDIISVVPKVDSTQFEKVFNNNLQDLLMVVYLANITRSQYAIAERLQALV